jgi:hypothetical protein
MEVKLSPSETLKVVHAELTFWIFLASVLLLLKVRSDGGLDFSNRGAGEISEKVCADLCIWTISTGLGVFLENIIVENKRKVRQQAIAACFVGKCLHMAKVRCKYFLKKSRYFIGSPVACNS